MQVCCAAALVRTMRKNPLRRLSDRKPADRRGGVAARLLEIADIFVILQSDGISRRSGKHRPMVMRTRNYIALLLLAVYLLATGGAAYRSLSCQCLEPAHAAEHLCCADGHDTAEMFDIDEALHAACPCDRHSTAIALYTAVSDDARPCKCAVLALPHCLAAAQAARLSAPKFRKERIEAPSVSLPQAPCLLATGLRAPPVSA